MDSGPPTEAGRAWFRIVCQVAEVGGIQRQQYTIQTSEREANGHGEVPFRPYSEELELILFNMNAATREAILANVRLFENSEDLESTTEFMVSSDSENSDEADQEDEEEGNGIQFSPGQVENFIQTLSRVEMDTLGADDRSCSICKEEYGKQRGENSTQPASEINPRLPDDEMPEYPVKLSCGHVLGECCIKTWLLAQPASCPTCRRQFRPA